MMVRTVGLGTALEVVALDVAGEALALADPDHVDDLAGREQGDVELLPDGVGLAVIVEAELAQDGDLGQVLELPELRLVELARLLDAKLDGRVAVPFGRPDAGDRVRLDGDDAHGDHRSVGLEHLSHADLSADQGQASEPQRAHLGVRERVNARRRRA